MAEAIAPGHGQAELKAAVSKAGVQIAADAEARLNKALSVFAGGTLKNRNDWEAAAGLRVRW